MKMKKINSARRCRLCARKEDLDSFYDIFDENPAMDIEKKITKLLPIVVMPWDPMPHNICLPCVDKLNSFDDFYETSLKAEKFLRSLHPSAPDTPSALDPLVQVLDPPAFTKTSIPTPHNNHLRQPPATTTPPHPPNNHNLPHPPNNHIHQPPVTTTPPHPPNNRNTPEDTPEQLSERTLNYFIVNALTRTDSIFTCRVCYRTFTKESSALNHTCVRLEDTRELEGGHGPEGSPEEEMMRKEKEKSLPPLKIRLFSVKSGMFVCYLCKALFEEKKEMVSHIRGHLVEGRPEKEQGRRKRKRRASSEDGLLEGVKRRRGRKKKKRVRGPGRRRKTAESIDTEETCTSVSSEQPMQRVVNSEDEIEIKYESIHKSPTPVPAPEEPPQEPPEEEPPDEPPEEPPEEDTEDTEDTPILLEDDPPNDMAEEVTVVQVVNNKAPTSFSSCVFCDKVFATKGALIAHQRRHMQGCFGINFEEEGGRTKAPEGECRPEGPGQYLCSICAMTFTNRKTLLEHEQYHMVDVEALEALRRSGEEADVIAIGVVEGPP